MATQEELNKLIEAIKIYGKEISSETMYKIINIIISEYEAKKR